jgi:PTS system trehalose-specific IIC component
MGKYQSDVKRLLELVGGKENINAVTHCLTRLRFALADPSLAQIKAIEGLKIVKGCFTQAGQFQVIIGNEVAEFYNEFVEFAGISTMSKDETKKAAKSNLTPLQKLMDNLAEIFSPLIPALVIGGLILGFRNILGEVEFANGTIVSQSQFWAGVNHFLWLIGEAIFHFLPVGIVWSITKKMGTTQILGIVLGLTLVSPQLENAWGVAGLLAEGGTLPYWDFGFTTLNMVGYQAQVVPAILAGFALVYLERFARKITPQAISMIVVPFIALLPAVILAHTLLGPVGWWIGSKLAELVFTGLTSAFSWLFAGVFGFIYAPLVVTGLHHMSNAIDMQLVAEYGGTILWPMIALSNIAQGSAVLAMLVYNRKDEEEKQVALSACISAYLGVTEPALFGVNLKYGFPFLAAIIGSAIAAIISVGSQVMANSIGIGGLPGILSIQTNSMVIFAISMMVAIIVPFILTLVLAKNKLSK